MRHSSQDEGGACLTQRRLFRPLIRRIALSVVAYSALSFSNHSQRLTLSVFLVNAEANDFARNWSSISRPSTLRV